MELTLDEALQQGIAAHKEGKLQEAERFYRAILQAQPEHPDANHNLGVLAVTMGKPLEALPLFQQALHGNPHTEQFWLSYIDSLIRLEHFDEANRVLVESARTGLSSDKLDAFKSRLGWGAPNDTNKPAKGLTLSEKRKKLAEKKKSKKRKAQGDTSNAAPSKDQLDQLLEYYQADRLAEAEPLAVSLTEQFPNHPIAWKILAALLAQTGRWSLALGPMQRSARVSPQDAEAHSNLAATFNELGEFAEGEASARLAIGLNPEFAEAHNNLGISLKKLGRLSEAAASYKEAISLRPDYDRAYNNLGTTLQEMTMLEESEASLRRAIKLRPSYAEAHNNLGNTLKELGKFAEAQESFTAAVSLQPDLAEAHYNLGNIFQDLGKLDDAETSYKRAIALKADYTEAHKALADAKKFLSKDEQYIQMQSLYVTGLISDEQRCQICFALAKACDDLGELSDAFEYYAEGNALRKKELGYALDRDVKLFSELKSSYSNIATQRLRQQTLEIGVVPIFIIGMPRSGTSLVEQILTAHSQITGAGELTFASKFGGEIARGAQKPLARSLQNFRVRYLDALRKRSDGGELITDKLPQNFLYLGLILAAIPEAKVVHLRRDGAAVCWSNYIQYFSSKIGYCYSLEDTLGYYNLYKDLMDYWHEALPGKIYDLDYEALTENQEGETRKLICYLGLEWDEACLSPHENRRGVATASASQVRKKVYSGSSEKWKRYKPYLNGALDHLSVGNQ